jgi:hypothetical protein
MVFACIFNTFDARSRNFPFLRAHARWKTAADKCSIAFPCRFFHRACARAPPICKCQTVLARAPYLFAYIRIYLSAHTGALWPIGVYGCIWADKGAKGRIRAHGPQRAQRATRGTPAKSFPRFGSICVHTYGVH